MYMHTPLFMHMTTKVVCEVPHPLLQPVLDPSRCPWRNLQAHCIPPDHDLTSERQRTARWCVRPSAAGTSKGSCFAPPGWAVQRSREIPSALQLHSPPSPSPAHRPGVGQSIPKSPYSRHRVLVSRPTCTPPSWRGFLRDKNDITTSPVYSTWRVP